MKVEKRALTKTQQAPPESQASRFSPTKSALKKAQFSSGGSAVTTRYRAATVSSELSQPENRLRRSQPTTPTELAGGGSSG